MIIITATTTTHYCIEQCQIQLFNSPGKSQATLSKRHWNHSCSGIKKTAGDPRCKR